VRNWLWLAILSALLVGLAACSGEAPAETPPAGTPPDLNGPALIMFYTDN